MRPYNIQMHKLNRNIKVLSSNSSHKTMSTKSSCIIIIVQKIAYNYSVAHFFRQMQIEHFNGIPVKVCPSKYFLNFTLSSVNVCWLRYLCTNRNHIDYFVSSITGLAMLPQTCACLELNCTDQAWEWIFRIFPENV